MSIFTKVAIKKPRFNTFDLSHKRKYAMAFGQLYPCFIAETVPNDTFRVSTSQLVRMAPMIAPLMHEVSVYVHFFYCPTRVAWPNFPKFINGGKDGTAAPTFPFLQLLAVTQSSLGESLGLPEWSAQNRSVSAVPFYIYQKIWYDYFRDQNLSTEIPILEYEGDRLSDGDNAANFVTLIADRQRSWMHDYFTSALPWTQRGVEATIPLGTSADLTGTGALELFGNDPTLATSTGTGIAEDSTLKVRASNAIVWADQPTQPDRNMEVDITPHTRVDLAATTVDLSTATAASINDLRRAFRLQEWLELNARAGARYNEAIRAHFGIDPGDHRIDRPIFIGGSRTPIQISEVLQTSETATTPQGTMSGHGVSLGGKNMFSYRCREHGYIMGIMSIMPKSSYQQGIPKHWFKFDKFDYFWQQFANIGEQAILNKELYVANDGADDNVFGYTPRYAEYKYIPDTVHGPFKTSLNFWHGGRIFSARPALNETFVTMQRTEINRIFAVPGLSEQQFYVMCKHKVKAKRPMPYFGTPTI